MLTVTEPNWGIENLKMPEILKARVHAPSGARPSHLQVLGGNDGVCGQHQHALRVAQQQVPRARQLRGLAAPAHALRALRRAQSPPHKVPPCREPSPHQDSHSAPSCEGPRSWAALVPKPGRAAVTAQGHIASNTFPRHRSPQ